MKAVYPLHNIERFTHSSTEKGFYISPLTEHLMSHDCVTRPHKHDFYLVILLVKGSGKQEIDFKLYDMKEGSVYFMMPGQIHRLLKCSGSQGYVLFHTRDYYEVGFNNRSLRDYPFYFCSQNIPYVQLEKTRVLEIESYFKELFYEYTNNEPGRYQKICSLIELMYISLSREYKRSYSTSHFMSGIPYRLRQFEELLDNNLVKYKAPADYARMMKITTRQLNRVCQETLGKTTSDVIIDRLILEAKRNLLHSDINVAEVAAALGFYDTGYFTRLFRKKTGMTPSAFCKKHSPVIQLA